MLSPNVDRWCFASIAKHFDTLRGDYFLYVEGQERLTNDLTQFIELRIDGPNATEQSKGYWKLYFEINVLCQATKSSDAYAMRRLTGKVSSMFYPCISVYKYGTGDEDDQSLFGVLQRLDDEANRNNMQTSHFGQVDPVNRLEQATVESHYVMFVEG